MIHKTKNHHHKLILMILVATVLVTLLLAPEFYMSLFAEADYSLVLMLALYLPGFFLLAGLIETWIPEKYIRKHLGKHSGLKGSVYCFFIGAIMPGPIYAAFPLAVTLRKKGVTMFNITLFIGAWSGVKISEEVFELQFLGLKFMLIRTLLTIPFIIISAYIIDRMHIEYKNKNNTRG